MSDGAPPVNNATGSTDPSGLLQGLFSRLGIGGNGTSSADAAAAKAAADLAALRTSTRGTAGNTVDQFFKERGLDPAQYEPDIKSQLDAISGGISSADPNPGAYYKTAPQDIFNDLTSAAEARANNSLDSAYAPNFSTQKIGNNITDPITTALQSKQRGSADQIVQNMLKRGVLTQSGYNAAENDLNAQDAGVRTKLAGFGQNVIAGGRQSLDDIINNARQSASSLRLGQTFDPSTYGSSIDDTFNKFVNTLGDQVNAKVGNSNLYQTNGLAAVGGAAQGAGNTKYDPNAAAGIITDPNDPTNPQNAKQSSSSENVF